MSAGDMFVPSGNEHARPNFTFKRNSLDGTAKLVGGAITTLAVLLATQLEAVANLENEELASVTPDAQNRPKTNTALEEEGFSVNSVLGTIDETEVASAALAAGSTGLLSGSAGDGEIGFQSEEGLPDGFVTHSPEVTDPFVKGGEPDPFDNDQVNIFEFETNGTEVATGTQISQSLATFFLPSDLLLASGLQETLLEMGVDIVQGPGNLVTIVATPEQVAELIEIANNALDQDDDAITNEPLILEGTDVEDIITGGNGNDQIRGYGANDFLTGLDGGDLIDGGGGSDTANYIQSDAAVTIDLDVNTASGGHADGDQLISIENLIGSEFDDILRGNDAENALFGEGGEDFLFGGAGADDLTGGAGADFIDGGTSLSDTANYFESDAAVNVSLLNDTASGGHASGDELDNIENLNGSLHDDFLEGDALDNRLGGHHGEDTLLGHDGDDTLLGGNLGDLLDGGDGIDTADYTASVEGVQVNLLTGVHSGGEAEGDTLVSIENLAGSAHNDVLDGDDSDNRLTGRDGDDILNGNGGNDRLVGGLGADHLDGGEGNRDAADYSAATEAVGLALDTGGFLGEATGDTFESIEFVVGTDFDDIIVGDNAINRLDGGIGFDDLDGGAGNDTLLGGLDDDTLTGGEGNDVFIFESSNEGADTITDFEAGLGRTDRIWLRDHEFDDFDSLLANTTDTVDGALIQMEGDSSILLEGVHSTELVQDDFILA